MSKKQNLEIVYGRGRWEIIDTNDNCKVLWSDGRSIEDAVVAKEQLTKEAS